MASTKALVNVGDEVEVMFAGVNEHDCLTVEGTVIAVTNMGIKIRSFKGTQVIMWHSIHSVLIFED